MIALLPAALSLYAVAAVPTITPTEAARHVGQEVIVQGTISQITTTVNLTTHINFGGLYPNHAFTATILKARQSLFTGVRARFEGKVAEVQGTVLALPGQAGDHDRRAGQLRLVQEGAPSSAGAAAGPGVADPRFDPRGADFADSGRRLQGHGRPAVGPHRGRGRRQGRRRVRDREGRVHVGDARARVLGQPLAGPGGRERPREQPVPAASRGLPLGERDDARQTWSTASP